MRKILDIYKEYKIPPKLQQHMFRVSGIICYVAENTNLIIDKKKLIKAGLLHDMGNILKMDFYSNIPINTSYSVEEKEYWNKVKNEYKTKYGNHTDVATLAICRELGISADIIFLLNNLGFKYVCDIANGSLEKQILKYGDLRVGLYGIISLKERIEDANVRYNGIFSDVDIACTERIENQIFSHSNIKPEDITDESIAPYIETLKNFEI